MGAEGRNENWEQRGKKVEMVCPQGGGEERSYRCRRAQGTMTGYSVSEVAHGDQVSIRDGSG
jgi:hypothetical protein